MDGLRLSIAVDKCAAVKIGDLEKETRSKKVVKPKFTTGCWELLFGKARMSSLCEHMLGNKRWGPPPVDEDWHACCLAPEWEDVCYEHKDWHQAVKSKKSEEDEKARVLWALKEAKDRGVDFYDAGHE